MNKVLKFNSVIISVSIPQKMLHEFDTCRKGQGYNRSEAMRESIRRFILTNNDGQQRAKK